MLRRVLTVLLALGLIFSLAACSGGDEEGGAEGGGEFTLSTGLDENGFFKGVKAADCVALPQYKGITVSNDVKVPNAAEVQFQIENVVLANYQTFVKVTDRMVVAGDEVNIDYVGSIDGVEFDRGSTQGRGTDVTAGAKNYIDDFLDQIIGHMPGETFDVNVTFPDPYPNDPTKAGKRAKFVTTINYIKEPGDLPELTDAIAKDYGFDTAAELQADVEEWVLEQARNAMVDDIVDKAVVKTVPESVMEYCRNYLATVYEIQQGISLGGSRETFLAENAESVNNLCRYYLVVQAICEQEGLRATAADLTDPTVSGARDSFGEPYALRYVLSERILPQFIIDNAVIEY
ncbi:MAG: FKBP-type peptidyl-prolyl cis-trans isomerase [Oscillospiraceae bacterium]|nr:FKBP-type peptidyl-prolyl cis-trans isomerase [Oscillospiraceae bacterium]